MHEGERWRARRLRARRDCHRLRSRARHPYTPALPARREAVPLHARVQVRVIGIPENPRVFLRRGLFQGCT